MCCMLKLFSFLFLLMFCVCGYTQNVGIGTNSPAEKLDVNGNLNISGQLKLNNNAGTAGQVLMKDASNNPVWGDISAYKNIMVFGCTQTIGGSGAGNCSANWTVPAGVNTIIVECWGGGGSGGNVSGGGGGGYVTAKYSVASGDIASLQMGAGGTGGLPGSGNAGGTTFFSLNGAAIFAEGGGGATVSLSSSYSITLPAGGGYLVSGINNNYIGYSGSAGQPSRQLSTQVNATSFADIRYYGDGGDAALIPGSGSKGGFYQSYSGLSQVVYSVASKIPGSGGAADFGSGSDGTGGRIIIHY